MNNDNWYRNREWNMQIEKAFGERLSRVRSKYNAAQYARIQAGYLGKEHPLVALQLLDRVIHEYQEISELSQAYYQKAECLLVLNRETGAIDCFRSSFRVMREYPNARNQSYFAFGLWAIKSGKRKLFDEALQVVEEFGGKPGMISFPSDIFKYCTIKAIILFEKGQKGLAREYAEKALEAASRKNSGLRYHPNLGVVDEIDPETAKKLKAIIE